MSDKALHLLLNGKAKEIALAIPVKKRAEILNNLIVSSLIDETLLFEIDKVLDSETAEEVFSDLPQMSGGSKRAARSPRRTSTSRPAPRKKVVKKVTKPVVEEVEEIEEEIIEEVVETVVPKTKEEPKSSVDLDPGGFF